MLENSPVTYGNMQVYQNVLTLIPQNPKKTENFSI